MVWEYYFSCAFNIIHPQRVKGILEQLTTIPVGDVDVQSCTIPGVYFFDCDHVIRADNFTESIRAT